MHLRYALLALLGEGEAHGYELLKRFNRRIGPFQRPRTCPGGAPGPLSLDTESASPLPC